MTAEQAWQRDRHDPRIWSCT